MLLVVFPFTIHDKSSSNYHQSSPALCKQAYTSKSLHSRCKNRIHIQVVAVLQQCVSCLRPTTMRQIQIRACNIIVMTRVTSPFAALPRQLYATVQMGNVLQFMHTIPNYMMSEQRLTTELRPKSELILKKNRTLFLPALFNIDVSAQF